jgi:formyltetrahydrofolate-dependent phosphoribosylglycinamide formyltransferase
LSNLVVFASGSGTNFLNIIEACKRNEISADITGLITDKAEIGAIEHARKFAIPHKVILPANFSSEPDFAEALITQLNTWHADLLILAGYLKKIPEQVINAYPDHILNIHPALLPKFGGKGFYGKKVHRAVIEAGESESGCSVHIVTKEFDEGPVLGQIKVPVKEDDTPETLAKRVLKQEHQLYPKVIQDYLINLESKQH